MVWESEDRLPDWIRDAHYLDLSKLQSGGQRKRDSSVAHAEVPRR